MSSSNPPPTLSAKSASSSKTSNTSSQVSPAHSQTTAYFSSQGLGQSRSGGFGSFGAGANSRASPAPRKDQGSKNKHKGSKKYRLGDEDALAESAAMHSVNSRKGQTSITHLMQFALPPRPQFQQQHRYGGHSRNSRRPTWGLGSGYHAVDKARYVHANYRFIVDPRGDYHAQSVDADVHLDWNNVLQILVSEQSQSASCPICLGTPVAPRMAKCGHIFCLPCLIRYMHSEDGANSAPEKRARWKKCPICYDSIYISETRPVRWYIGEEGEPPREGMDIVLRLVERKAGSTLAMPKESTDALGKGEDVPWHVAAEVMDYGRVMKGSEDYMLDQLDGYIQDIKRTEQEDELMFGEDTEWTGRAIRMLHEAKDKIKGIGNPPAMPKKPEEPKPKRALIEFNPSDEGVPEMYAIQQAARSGQAMPSTSPPPTLPTPLEGSSTATPNGAQPPFARSTSQPAASVLSTSLADFKARQHAQVQPDSYLFYHALLHYYLSPLDIRILKAAFGTYEAFPSSILPRVERVSTGHIVDDDLRRRTKYLAHLPYGCEVGFLECDWTDTVPTEILDKFKPDIERRRRRNMDKEAREEKERIQAQKAEDREFFAARRRRPSMPNDNFSTDDFQPLVSAEVSESATSVDGDRTGSSPPWAAHRTHSSAFASLASPGTSPSAARTVWGTTAVPLTSPELRAMQNQGPVDDGWLQDWEKDFINEEDLIAQVQAASLAEGEASSSRAAAAAASAAGGAAAAAGGGGGSKGKKKGKKITLMSTTARRGA